MLNVTEKAGQKIKALLIKQDKLGKAGLRVKVIGGGCSGLQYQLYFDEETHEEDIRVEGDSFQVFIDPKSAPLLDGSELEFDDGLNGSGFQINNPNAESTCGCGKSFCA